MSLLTGEIRKGVTLAGRYRVLRRLGAGGMATVFLAEDERLGREVAVKRLHTDAPEASLRRFEQEARLGAALNHPNLVSVWDTVAAEEGALIVMEYVPGRPLGELAGGRPMPASKALPILKSVAAALDHAHANGVVHRDVKPGNIIVGDDGFVKLADLGIAKAVGSSQITSEGSVVGTLPYMSPERLAGPGAGGPQSDVYALAAVAFELLSGHPPAQPVDTEEAASAHPRSLAREWPDGPPAAVAVLERALADEPADRQPSAGRMVEELESGLDPKGATTARTRVLGGGAPPGRTRPTVAAAGGSTGPGSGAVAAVRRRWPNMWAGRAVAAALIAALFVAGMVSAFSGGGSGDETAGGDAKAAKEPKPEKEPAAAPAPAPEPEAVPEPSAAELNAQGFALIQQERYDEAIPLLEQAVGMYPEGSRDLTYAYALFNLGHALRMAGRPEEAIPLLEERLEIPDQTGVVERELEAARADAGFSDEGDEGSPGNGNGKAKGHDKVGDDD